MHIIHKKKKTGFDTSTLLENTFLNALKRMWIFIFVAGEGSGRREGGSLGATDF